MHKQTSQEHGNPCVFVMIAQVRRLTIEQNQGFVVSFGRYLYRHCGGGACVGPGSAPILCYVRPYGHSRTIAAVAGFFLFGFACMRSVGWQGSSHKPVFRKLSANTRSIAGLCGRLLLVQFVSMSFRHVHSPPRIRLAVDSQAATWQLPFLTVLTGLRITYAIGSVVPFLLTGAFILPGDT